MLCKEGGNMVASQVRFSDEMMEYIRTESDRLGIPQNAFILVLLEQGKKVWESGCVIHQGERK